MLSLLIPIYFLSSIHTAQATVAVHYFPQKACNANTAISDYTNPAPAAGFKDCVAAPPNTAALNVDGVDEGCTRKFSSHSLHPTTKES
jgi:hypothetical protein